MNTPRPAPLWPLPRVVAHRCGGALAPENTLVGLDLTQALGFCAVEFDVMLSADGTPWLIHDETLERTTDGHGKVCEASDAVLAMLDAGARHHRAYAGEPLPTFAVTAARCRALGLKANVEIKPAKGFEAQTGEVVARAILEHWAGDALPLVSSFSDAALAAARRVAPDLPLGYLWDVPPEDWLARAARHGVYSLHCSARGASEAVLAAARAHDIPVLCWTVNDRAQAENLLARGVTSVICDQIGVMRGL